MERLTSIYRFLHTLSIDIAVGTVCCALFYSSLLDVEIRPYGLIALFLTVWVIYTADHLRDAYVIGEKALSVRREFHFRYRKLLSTCLMGAVILDAAVIVFMRHQVLYFGVYLFGLVVVYLVIQKFLKILKEVFIAVLYTCGILLPSLSVTTVDLQVAHYVLFVQLGIVAWVNLLMFSWFDFEQDLSEHQHSFATAVGKKETAVWLSAISLIHGVLFAYQYKMGMLITPSTVLAIMNVLLILIFIYYRDKQKEFFRWMGDAVFFVPGIVWLWLRS